jgi:hypothetical protein
MLHNQCFAELMDIGTGSSAYHAASSCYQGLTVWEAKQTVRRLKDGGGAMKQLLPEKILKQE